MEQKTVIMSSTTNNEEGLFEGCGREGPILAIFLSEFHHIAGPKIVCQYPVDTISKEIFDAIASYIIPKTHLQRLVMTVNVLGKKVIGFPIHISNDKYERNAYYFNICFVCDAWARTVQYEQVLVKIAEFFNGLELECNFLSKITPDENGDQLIEIFQQVLDGLNSPLREVHVIVENGISKSLLKLKVVQSVLHDPPTVASHQVPVFIIEMEPSDRWDLTTQQLIPYINGFNYVSKIGSLADVDTNLVKACLQNLLYYGAIKLITIFQYSNTYCTLPVFHNKLVMATPTFKKDCIDFVTRHQRNKPHFCDIIRFYSAMKRGVTIKDLCSRFRTTPSTPSTTGRLPSVLEGNGTSDHSLSSSNHSNQSPRTFSTPTTPIKMKPTHHYFYPAKLKAESQTILGCIDERYLILFGLIHGFIRKIEKYPSLQLGPQRHSSFSLSINSSRTDNESKDVLLRHRQKYSAVYTMFDAHYNYDEICLAHDLTQAELEDIIDRDPEVVIIFHAQTKVNKTLLFITCLHNKKVSGQPLA